MQNISESLVRQVIEQVLVNLEETDCQKTPKNSLSQTPKQFNTPFTGKKTSKHYFGRLGQFQNVDEAVAASRQAFNELSERTVAERKKILQKIRRICIEQNVELGTMEFEETKIGRLEHKIDKLLNVGYNAQGTEALKSDVFSGDFGLTVIEYAPFGVIGAVTPVTHSLPTIANNAINMIAAGNTVVFNPHPNGKRVAAEGVLRFNRAIFEEHGIDNLLSIITEPTFDSATQLFQHPDVNLLVVSGGTTVVQAAMSQSKRVIAAGPGNPPVVVDETADLNRAARCIIQGASYDNNLLCLSEKEVFVVESVFDDLMTAMEDAGAILLNSEEVRRITQYGIDYIGVNDNRHPVPSRSFLGKDASFLAEGIGKSVPKETLILFGETDFDNPFVSVEQMMPFLPFVRCQNIDEAIAAAKYFEHGFQHTAVIHSNNVANMNKMGKALNTTIFVKNGPSTAGNGGGGEGFGSYSIAGLTGEGITQPLTFTRSRRFSTVENLNIL